MKIGKTLYVTQRKWWRQWLKKHHKTAKDIWLIYYKKDSGKPRIPYNDAVEEALCFGWIDSTVKSIDKNKFAQRFSPRRPNSILSETNTERIRHLIKQKKMTSVGLQAVKHRFSPASEIKIATDILKALKQDKSTWENFKKFSDSYKRIQIGWVEGARTRPTMFKQRLRYFLEKTKNNKKFGMVQ